MTSRAFAACALLLAVLCTALAYDRGRNTLGGDFRAFYCAGELARTHAFNYSQAAIVPCESRPAPSALFTAHEGTSVPAPLPGYAVLPFAVLSLVPYPFALACWAVLLLTCGVTAAALFARLQWTHFDRAIVLLAIPLGAIALPPGELTPVALLGIALIVYGCERDRVAARIAGMLLIACEPQIALGALAALAGARRGAWREIGAVAATLGIACVLTIGPAASVSYVRDLLPAHVASELLRAQQYTLSWALAQLGVAAPAALTIGRIVYLASILGAYLIGRRSMQPGIACAAGAALAIAAGPFVHLDHFLCALPAALAVARTWRPFGLAVALLLALPVPVLFADPLLICAVPVVSWWFASSAYVALYATSTAAALAYASGRMGLAFRRIQTGSGAWSAYVAEHDVAVGALIWVVKAPAWIALIAGAAAAGALAVRREGAGGGNQG